ncbi:Origin recognition complex subunit 2 [Podospora pseudopauciseta]|uniref:Origin recognition complex subunit 2 n=1 Tax=Podospora pseudopauciseta TaxID=2093780 RepID=A0ABR0HQQ6_9PEZI|nr:Origin recognition complex subunit 2 [Podospora pseudopauciseta]
MPPKKTTNQKAAARVPRKRPATTDPYEIPEEDEIEPPKRRRHAATVAADTDDATVSTPSASRLKKTVATPIKLNGLNGIDTPSRKNNADRSARRKSARALVDRVISGAISDDEAEEGDIAREIYESSEDEEDEEDEEGEGENLNGETEPTTTPSKFAPGRKRKTTTTRTRKRSPTPPRDLPPHEQYFFQNKPGLSKTSNNTLSSLQLLTHDEYFSLSRDLSSANPHRTDITHLASLHVSSFPQWAFELSQSFSLCLYGYGSKRQILHKFATYLSSHPPCSLGQANKIVIINGYTPSITIRELLCSLASAVSSPTTTLPGILSYLTTHPKITLTILLNSVSSPYLRKGPFQSIISTLASHAQVYLCCTTDSPDFALLWDSAVGTNFQFLYHDCTTFCSYSPSELEVVDSVHELLGRKTRRVGGKEGVAFVLRSLPENAKSLFRLLVGEVLCADEGDGQGQGQGEEMSVEYRMVYNKAVEEFICSSEMAFRTLLKEFHDHQIITSHKDALGTELLSLPFGKEELEGILEELTT